MTNERHLTCNDLIQGEYGEIIGGMYSNIKDEIGTIIYRPYYSDYCIVYKSNMPSWIKGIEFSNDCYWINKIAEEEVKKEKNMSDKKDNSDNTRMVAINFQSKEDFNKFTKALNINTEDNIGLDYAIGIRLNIKYLGYSGGRYSFEDDYSNLKEAGGAIIDLTNSSFKVIEPPREVKISVGEYEGIINNDGEMIKVGCQTIRFEEVEKVYQEMLKARKNS